MAEAPAAAALHIIVTCSNRKRHAVPNNLRLGDLQDLRPRQRFAAWTRRLTSAPATTSAAEMYAGEHWQVASTMPVLTNRPVTLWVCSAGYGLIPADALIRPYAATFSSGQADSVGKSQLEVRDWWCRLAEWPGPAEDEPRSFASLAQEDPHSTIVAVLSEAYLRACADDLRKAAAELADERELSIVGPSGRGIDVEDLIVPVSARLRPVVGGSLQALNIRVAAHLLQLSGATGSNLSRPQLMDFVRQATKDAPPDSSRRVGGQKMTDDEVRQYISLHSTDKIVSATGLLRLLRDTGYSCEQARFGELFAEFASTVRH